MIEIKRDFKKYKRGGKKGKKELQRKFTGTKPLYLRWSPCGCPAKTLSIYFGNQQLRVGTSIWIYVARPRRLLGSFRPPSGNGTFRLPRPKSSFCGSWMFSLSIHCRRAAWNWDIPSFYNGHSFLGVPYRAVFSEGDRNDLYSPVILLPNEKPILASIALPFCRHRAYAGKVRGFVGKGLEFDGLFGLADSMLQISLGATGFYAARRLPAHSFLFTFRLFRVSPALFTS